MKRTPLKRSNQPLKRSRLRVAGQSDTAELKREIQALVREIGIKRDGGCILRDYPVTGKCGGHRKDGELILQAEHLESRSNSATYGDMRNIVILCQKHHMYFKQQNGALYWQVIERHVGPLIWDWLQRVRADKRPHKMDWRLVKVALEQELKTLKQAELMKPTYQPSNW